MRSSYGMAFVLWLLYAGRRPFLHHMVTSLHLFAFILLALIMVPLSATLMAVFYSLKG